MSGALPMAASAAAENWRSYDLHRAITGCLVWRERGVSACRSQRAARGFARGVFDPGAGRGPRHRAAGAAATRSRQWWRSAEDANHGLKCLGVEAQRQVGIQQRKGHHRRRRKLKCALAARQPALRACAAESRPATARSHQSVVVHSSSSIGTKNARYLIVSAPLPGFYAPSRPHHRRPARGRPRRGAGFARGRRDVALAKQHKAPQVHQRVLLAPLK